MRNYSNAIKATASDLITALYRSEDYRTTVNLFDHVGDLRELCRLAKRHHRLAEHACNGLTTPRMETEERNIEEKIVNIVKQFNIRAEFSGDPRGYTVKLHTANQKIHNTWGGAETGYGI